ncbi:hypothetical protein DL98DRAFT_634021 [Cadophora sp. DSE1049]|nr:hypothetical protein DL98DRAFT_634021 [Cadophora sp. DSE1049]
MVVGETPAQSIARESAEEGGLSAEVMKKARPIRGGKKILNMDYVENKTHARAGRGWGLEARPEEGSGPAPADGEVDGFYLTTAAEAQVSMLKGEFTPDAGKIPEEWLFSKGYIKECEMGEGLSVLSRELPFPTMTQ